MVDRVESDLWVVLVEPPSISALSPEVFGYFSKEEAEADVDRVRAWVEEYFSEALEEFDLDEFYVTVLQLGMLKGEAQR